jgi:hypothetical protein
MNAIINRLLLASRILFGSRVLVLEKRYDKAKKMDKITLWGTIQDRPEQVETLSKMTQSLFADMNKQELEKFYTLQRPNE